MTALLYIGGVVLIASLVVAGAISLVETIRELDDYLEDLES